MRKKERDTTLPENLKKALEEYQPDSLKDTEELYEIKKAVESLPEVQKIVFLLYTELQSYTELSKRLKVSRSTCFWMVRQIREDIKKKLNR